MLLRGAILLDSKFEYYYDIWFNVLSSSSFIVLSIHPDVMYTFYLFVESLMKRLFYMNERRRYRNMLICEMIICYIIFRCITYEGAIYMLVNLKMVAVDEV